MSGDGVIAHNRRTWDEANEEDRYHQMSDGDCEKLLAMLNLEATK